MRVTAIHPRNITCEDAPYAVIVENKRRVLETGILIPGRQLARVANNGLAQIIRENEVRRICHVYYVCGIFDFDTGSTMSRDLITLLAPVILIQDFIDRLTILIPLIAIIREEEGKLNFLTIVRTCFRAVIFSKKRQVCGNVFNDFLTSNGFSKGDYACALR